MLRKGKLRAVRQKSSAVVAALSVIAGAIAFGSAARSETDWSGLYGGVHVGGGTISVDDDGGLFDMTGAIAGGQIGYNWQTGNKVFSFEGDVSWSDVSDDVSQTLFGFTQNVELSQQILASARIRIGWAQGNVLYFATVGAAYSQLEFEQTVVGPGVNASVSQDSDIGGVIGGGGIEWAINNNWSLRGEALVSRMGPDFDLSDGVTQVNGRVGLNFRF